MSCSIGYHKAHSAGHGEIDVHMQVRGADAVPEAAHGVRQRVASGAVPG